MCLTVGCQAWHRGHWATSGRDGAKGGTRTRRTQGPKDGARQERGSETKENVRRMGYQLHQGGGRELQDAQIYRNMDVRIC